MKKMYVDEKNICTELKKNLYFECFGGPEKGRLGRL